MKAIEIYEDMCQQEWDDDNLFEMARVSSKRHGTNGVIIWVGHTNKRHGLRVKVSNVRDKWSDTDHFVIMMPSLDYDPKKVAKWIDMPSVLGWIKLNQDLLYDYENGLIHDTDEFLDRISPYK